MARDDRPDDSNQLSVLRRARHLAFLGVPYAKPPIGELRFRAPVAPAAWTGTRDAVVYLIDYEQGALVPVPGAAGGHGEPLSVAGTIAGRAFSSISILRSKGDVPGLERLLLPLLDGTDRLGVIDMSFQEDALSERIAAACERYAHLVAMLIVTKRPGSGGRRGVRVVRLPGQPAQRERSARDLRRDA